MTQHEMIKSVRDLGMTCSVRDGEIRVNFKDGKEETAYYTNDREDAVTTAQMMIRRETEAGYDRYANGGV